MVHSKLIRYSNLKLPQSMISEVMGQKTNYPASGKYCTSKRPEIKYSFNVQLNHRNKQN